MKLLILGSEGFIGSHAKKYFLEQPHYEVYTADIVIRQDHNYQVINPEHADFSSIFSGDAFDVCINATGAANVQFSFRYPALDYILNVSNVFLMLDAIRRFNPSCKFINLSSAAVYGNPSRLPVSEKDVLQPLSPYGWHKLYSEQVCKEFADYFGMKTVSLRIFSAYGPGLRKQLFWDLFSKFIDPGKEVELFGSGDETRDFIFIDDLVHAMECVIRHADFDGRAINVSSGEETGIVDAAAIFKELLQSGKQIKFNGKVKEGDPKNWKANIDLLKSFGFSGGTDMQRGLHHYINWAKKQHP